MELARSSETWVFPYNTIQCHNPEDYNVIYVLFFLNPINFALNHGPPTQQRYKCFKNYLLFTFKNVLTQHLYGGLKKTAKNPQAV
jgi:hypothetical protein